MHRIGDFLLSTMTATMTTATATPRQLRRATHKSRHRRAVPLLLVLLASLLCSASAQSHGPSSQDPYRNGVRGGFSPSMAIIIVVLISSFFFMTFFSIYLTRCGDRADASSGPGGAAGGRALGGRSRRAAAQGLDPAVIATFPTLVYAEVKEHKVGKGALECAVCLSEFNDDEALRLLPKCDHVFHPDCIDAWLASHTTCPVCRTNLTPDPAPPADSSAAVAVPATASAGVDGEPPREGAERNDLAPAGPQDHVAITIDEEVEPGKAVQRVGDLPPTPPAMGTMARNESRSRQRWWSRSLGRPLSFPRSRSTGHSLAAARPGEESERYTLRLPDHIRRDVMAGKFQRSSSLASFPAVSREGSSRKGRGAGGEGTSRAGGAVGGRSFKLGRLEWAARSDRWAFFARTFSMKPWRVGDEGAVEGSTPKGGAGSSSGVAAGEGSVNGKVFPG